MLRNVWSLMIDQKDFTLKISLHVFDPQNNGWEFGILSILLSQTRTLCYINQTPNLPDLNRKNM